MLFWKSKLRAALRVSISLLLVTALAFELLGAESCSAASAKKLHAYTLARAPVYNKSGHRIGILEQGIVIRYNRQISDYVVIKYYGKTAYVPKKYLVPNGKLKQFIATHQNLFSYKATALERLKVIKSTGKGKLMTADKGTDFAVFGLDSKKVKVQIDGRFGFVDKACVKLSCFVDVTEFYKITGNSLGEKIVNFAKKFVGNPYVWGGTSLTSGCDCSGFVQGVYKNFGINLPRCSYQQAEVGKTVNFSELKPGDLIFYNRGKGIGHVTLYIGNGMVVQARGRKFGIVITRYDYDTPAWAKRVIGG